MATLPLDEKIESTRQRLAEVRGARLEKRRLIRDEMNALQTRFHRAQTKFQRVPRNAAHYAVAVENEQMPPYVLRNQAKLCQLMHRMCVEEDLLMMAKSQSRYQIREAQRALERIRQEAPLREILILNEIDAKAQEVAQLKKQLDAARAELCEIIEETAVQEEVYEQLTKIVVLPDQQKVISDPASELKGKVENLARWLGDLAFVGVKKSFSRYNVRLGDIPVRGQETALSA